MSRRNILTAKQVSNIAKYLQEGISFAELCERYRVKPPTMRLSLRRAGYGEILDKAIAPRVITTELLAKANELIAQGKSQADAARAIGFTPQALCTAKKRGRPPIPTRMRKAPKDTEAARRPDMQSHIEFNTQRLKMSLRATA
jgi:hypothetical protein